MKNFYLLVILVCFIDFSKEEDCGAKRDGYYVTGGTQQSIGNMAFAACCTACYNGLYHAMYYYSPNANCLCYTGEWTYAAGANYIAMAYHQDIFHLTSIVVAAETGVTIVDPYRTVEPNDKKLIFAIDDINDDPIKISRRIHFYDISDDNLKITLNEKKESRRNSSYTHDLVAQGKYMENYIVKFKYFASNAQVSDSKFWLVSMRTNDNYISVTAESMTVTAPSQYVCKDMDFTVSSLKSRHGKGRIRVTMETQTTCNTDISNFRFEFKFEEDVEFYKAEPADGSIDISNVTSTANAVEVKFAEFYAERKISFEVWIVLKKSAQIHRGIKVSNVMVDAFYNIYDGTLKKMKTQRSTAVVVPDEKSADNGFGIFDKTCLKTYEGDQYQKFKLNFKDRYIFENCETYSPVHRILKTENGKCLEISTSGSFYGNCSSPDADVYTQDNYIYANGRDTGQSGGSLIAGGSKKQYYFGQRGNYGLRTDESDETEGIQDWISVLSGDGKYFACIAVNNRTNSYCVSFDDTKKATKVLPKQLHKILAFSEAKKKLYGEDIDGNILSIEGVTMKYISTSRWDKIQTNDVLTLATNISRIELNGSAVALSATVKVTYFGLFENDQPLVLWPPDSLCVSQVGTSTETALKNCNAIKNYCPKSRSRVYWITQTYASSTNGQVYCDMEFDEGGWIMLGNFTANQTKVAKSTFVSSKQTSDIFDVVKSNFEKFAMTSSALGQLSSNFGAIMQVRFYCTTEDVGRTIHMAVASTSEGLNFITYLSGGSQSSSYACRGYYVYPDDTSVLFEDCKKLGGSPGTSSSFQTGHWTNKYSSTYRIAQEPFHYTAFYTFDMTSLTCDTKVNSDGTIIKYGNWKIFVKNML